MLRRHSSAAVRSGRGHDNSASWFEMREMESPALYSRIEAPYILACLNTPTPGASLHAESQAQLASLHIAPLHQGILDTIAWPCSCSAVSRTLCVSGTLSQLQGGDR